MKKIKKIGIVTLYRDNFGSILQAYSTCHYLNTLGYQASLLINEVTEPTIRKFIRNVCWSIIYPGYFHDRLKSRRAMIEDSELLSPKTKVKMEEFIEATFSFMTCNSSNLLAINKEFDYFIVGSDQVWNGYSPFNFLVFADKEKRIAFAPSFGTSQIKKYRKKRIKKALQGFDKLSVREESGIKIIKELTERDAIRLSDPTLLLPKNEWEDFSKKGIEKQNYILLHFLNKPNDIAINTINEYLLAHSCTVYCICNYYEEYDRLKRYEFIDISPYDYVALIKNADFVFTDSFHSTLFSLNLETQFLTFERQYLHGDSQSSRIADLLQRVDMSERYFKDGFKYNFVRSNGWQSKKLFEDERKQLMKYLEETLEGR